MSEDQYMSEEREEEPAPTEVRDSQVYTQEMTPIEKMIPLEESPTGVHEEKLQEQKREIEQAHEEATLGKKKKQRRRTTTIYLSQILKQAERNGGEINKIRTSVESFQKQQRLAAVGQSQSIKQILSQFSQLHKQVTRIQKDIQRIRTGPATKTRIRKVAPNTTTSKPKSKKGKSVSRARVRRRT